MASFVPRMLLQQSFISRTSVIGVKRVTTTSRREAYQSVVTLQHVNSRHLSSIAHLPTHTITCSSSCCNRRNLSTGNDKNKDNEKLDPTLSDTTIISAEDAKLAMEAASTEQEGLTNLPGTGGKSGQKQLAIVFTCTKCNTRSAKQFTEQAYRNGVVLVRCPGCQNLHLIADRLGVFEDQGEDGQGWDIEKAMANIGENVRAVTNDNVLELTLQDVVGTEKMEEAVATGKGDDSK